MLEKSDPRFTSLSMLSLSSSEQVSINSFWTWCDIYREFFAPGSKWYFKTISPDSTLKYSNQWKQNHYQFFMKWKIMLYPEKNGWYNWSKFDPISFNFLVMCRIYHFINTQYLSTTFSKSVEDKIVSQCQWSLQNFMNLWYLKQYETKNSSCKPHWVRGHKRHILDIEANLQPSKPANGRF